MLKLTINDKIKVYKNCKIELDNFVYFFLMSLDEKAIYAAGLERGINQKNKSIIQRLSDKKMSIEEIAEIVELEVTEVEKIIEQENL